MFSGLAANVDIEIARHEGLVVPSQAVVDRKLDDLPRRVREHELVDQERFTAPVVFVVEDGKAVCRPVLLGPSSLSETIVAAGLDPESLVIIGPDTALETLAAGAAVRMESEPRSNDRRLRVQGRRLIRIGNRITC